MGIGMDQMVPGSWGQLLGLSRAEMICPHLGDPVLNGYSDLDEE